MISSNVVKPRNLLNFPRNFHTCTKNKLNLRSLVETIKDQKDHDQVHIVKKTLNHPPEIFYEVVSDVSSYHKFVPYCTKSFINRRDSLGEPIEAGLRVGWKSFDEEFVCHLQCQKATESSTIIAESITHSLFNHLYTKWTIEPALRKNSCNMKLELQYKFRSSIYNHFSSVFAESVSQLVIKAFEKRARELRRERGI